MLIYKAVAFGKMGNVKSSTAMDSGIRIKQILIFKAQTCKIVSIFKEMHSRPSERMFSFGHKIKEMKGKQFQREGKK